MFPTGREQEKQILVLALIYLTTPLLLAFNSLLCIAIQKKIYILIQSAFKIFISLEYIVSVVMYGNFNSFSISGK